MTRKRFIKMMMSYGIQRNQARKIANIAHSLGIPYGRANQMLQFLKCLGEYLSRAVDSLKQVTYSLKQFREAVKDADNRED